MPPKGPGGKPGGKKKKSTAPFDPVGEIKGMESIHEVLAKAEELRNYYQTERDKVNAMWEATKSELTELRVQLADKEGCLEDAERSHQVEMKVYQQKVRHLLYDQRVKVKQLKEENDTALREAAAAHEAAMAAIEAERQKLLQGTSALQSAHDTSVADQRDSHHYMITVTKRQTHERDLARLRASYEAKLATLREDLELRRRAEVNEIETQSNVHINNIIKQHEEKFAEMKTYYNGITKNNLEIIQSLKEEIATMKKNDTHNEALMFDIEQENSNLAAPLEEAQAQVAELQQKKKQYLQDQQRLRMTKSRLATLRSELAKLRERHNKLEAEYKETYDQREEIKGRFESALRDAMEVVDTKNTMLQQRLLEANAMVEERDAQLDGVMRAMGLEPSTRALVAADIDRTLSEKNQIIKDLHFELRKLDRQNNAVLTEYERRCRATGLAPLARENFVF